MKIQGFSGFLFFTGYKLATSGRFFVAIVFCGYHVKLIGYFGLLVRVQMAVGFHGSLYPFMAQAFRNQKRCAAHINQQAGVLTKTKVDIDTYLSVTKIGWENRPAKPREDSPQNEMRWHGNESSCINPQEAWI